MKKLSILICYIFIIVSNMSLFSESKTLQEIMKPEMIRVYDKQIFIVQGAEVFIYSLENFKLLKTFGKKGEGPGELSVSPMFYNTIIVNSNQIILNSFNKLVYYTREGKFINEVRKKTELRQIIPFGKNYLRLDQIHMEGKTQYQRLLLYDHNFNFIKEICRQKSSIQSVKRVTNIISDSMDFKVWKERLYVERSDLGFLIEVYNSNGQKIHQIKKKARKIPISKSYKKFSIQRFKNDPYVKEMGFSNFKKNVSDIQFPKYFPFIQSIDITDDRIYIRTYENKNNKEKCIITDLKGNIIKTLYLPKIVEAPFLAFYLGIRYYTFHNGKFYYLNENEDDETWNLIIQSVQ